LAIGGFNATVSLQEVRALAEKPEVGEVGTSIMFQRLSGGAVEGNFYEEEMGAWAVFHTKEHLAL
jgi:hypothetical protein